MKKKSISMFIFPIRIIRLAIMIFQLAVFLWGFSIFNDEGLGEEVPFTRRCLIHRQYKEKGEGGL